VSAARLGPRDVARATGVSTDTLRHYERLGLLPEVARTSSGYRRYSETTVSRVLLIQRALVIGFSLRDLKRVLTVRDRGGAPCRRVRMLVGDRLRALNQQIDDLLALRQDLQALVDGWDARLDSLRTGERAHLLETLGASPAIERRRTVRCAAPNRSPIR